MKHVLRVSVSMMVILVVAAATSHGDTAQPASSVPGSGGGLGNGQNLHGHHGAAPASQVQPSGPPRPPPFELTDPGPAQALWSYDQLTPDEQANVNRNMESGTWDAINGAYASAAAEHAQVAAAKSAALQLGVADLSLGEIGVVP